MDVILDFLQPIAEPYFTNMWWLIGAVTVLALLVFWRTYAALSKTYNQKKHGVKMLQEAGRVWKKAKFVPENARMREAGYLYKEFMTVVESSKEPFPLTVKNGVPTIMTKDEYATAAKLKQPWAISPLLFTLSLLYAAVVVLVNFETQWHIGLAAGATVPVAQILLMFVIKFARYRKNKFRKVLFEELREPSVDFIRMTTPYILVACYPQQFGRAGTPPFPTTGELTPGLVHQINEYKRRLQGLPPAPARTQTQPATAAQTQAAHIPTSTPTAYTPTPTAYTPTTTPRQAAPAPAPIAYMTPQPIAAVPAPAPTRAPMPAPTKSAAPMEVLDAATIANAKRATQEALRAALEDATNDILTAKAATQQALKAALDEAAVEQNYKAPTTPLANPSDATIQTGRRTVPTSMSHPADRPTDEFSLDSIGDALEAEIVSRRKKKGA